MIEIGTICIKTSGREKGKYAVVVKKVDKNFVMITGPKKLTGVKRRRANVLHLQETKYKLPIKEDASDEEVLEAWKKSGLINRLGLKLPTTLKEKQSTQKKKKPKPKSKNK